MTLPRFVLDMSVIVAGLRSRLGANLVDNALRYTPSGGQVRVSCGCRHSEGDSHILFEVADDGPGVSMEERTAIFRRFYRAAGATAAHGSGIGLSLVARIAELHQARIETDTGIDCRGLAVRLLFPSAVAART